MKKILCFGDSNTFGFNPENFGRYSESERWSGILKYNLKGKFDVIEAGCNDRTCFCVNPKGDEFTGFRVIQKYITPDTDIIIIALGSNDLQFAFGASIPDFEAGIVNLIKLAKDKKNDIHIVLVAPPFVTEDVLNGFFAYQFDRKSIENSRILSRLYKHVAENNNCYFADFSLINDISPADGLHFSLDGHKKAADYMEKFILKNFDYSFSETFSA